MIDPNDSQILKLGARVGEEIVTPEDLALAEASLEEAWAWVASYGQEFWSPTNPSTPPIARTVALAAAARCFQNPAGYLKEAGDQASLERGEDFARGAEPTVQEIAALRRAANSSHSTITSLRLENNEMYRPRTVTANPALMYYQMGVGDPDHKPIGFYGWRT